MAISFHSFIHIKSPGVSSFPFVFRYLFCLNSLSVPRNARIGKTPVEKRNTCMISIWPDQYGDWCLWTPETLLKILWNKVKTFLLWPHKREIKSFPTSLPMLLVSTRSVSLFLLTFPWLPEVGFQVARMWLSSLFLWLSSCATHSGLPSQSWCSSVAENTQERS